MRLDLLTRLRDYNVKGITGINNILKKKLKKVKKNFVL